MASNISARLRRLWRLSFILPTLAFALLEKWEHADFIRGIWPAGFDFINSHGMWVLVILIALFGIYLEFRKTGNRSVKQIAAFIKEAEDLKRRIDKLGGTVLDEPEEGTQRRYIINILNFLLVAEEPKIQAQKPYYRWAHDFYDYMFRLRDFFMNANIVVEENELLEYFKLLDLYRGRFKTSENINREELEKQHVELGSLQQNFGSNLAKHIDRMKRLHRTLSEFMD